MALGIPNAYYRLMPDFIWKHYRTSPPLRTGRLIQEWKVPATDVENALDDVQGRLGDLVKGADFAILLTPEGEAVTVWDYRDA